MAATHTRSDELGQHATHARVSRADAGSTPEQRIRGGRYTSEGWFHQVPPWPHSPVGYRADRSRSLRVLSDRQRPLRTAAGYLAVLLGSMAALGAPAATGASLPSSPKSRAASGRIGPR